MVPATEGLNKLDRVMHSDLRLGLLIFTGCVIVQWLYEWLMPLFPYRSVLQALVMAVVVYGIVKKVRPG